LIWHYNQDGARATSANATRFDNTTTPTFAWRDGTPSGLSISRISGTGNTMFFTLGFENYVGAMLPEVKLVDDIYASTTAATWANQGGILGISYTNVAYRGWIRLW